MTQPKSRSETERLYLQGDRHLHRAEYDSAIAIFEELLPTVKADSRLYFDLQRSLIKAYQQDRQLERAISLCQLVAESEISGNAIWGQNFLASLNPNYIKPNLEESELVAEQKIILPKTKPKTLQEFRQYCEINLLPQLKQFEQKRRYTLRTMAIAGLACLAITGFICLTLSYWVGIRQSLPLYLWCLTIPASVWIIFCRGCVANYRIGFKRNIIENIVNFISDGDRQLNYAANLFIENKRRTINAFTHSQILRSEVKEPDYLHQEDCVYGSIGNTDLFFAEIFVEDRQGGHVDEYGREQYRDLSKLFHGLFFEARFAKNFVSRTFVLPNDVKSKVASINSWRGELIKLEDPEFDRRFRVYGDNQVESRYILSTNLMNRLVMFDRKAGRKVHLSFIDGFVYVAIPYRYRLFEPRLFKTMLSFTPLKEYFLDLQLMIGIVEDLNLNRRIWG